jgi:DNA-binding GntR family transcriptional regulator
MTKLVNPQATKNLRSDKGDTRSASAIRTVIEGVIELLESGRLAPGQRLVEAELCVRFGIGRNSVREGLQRLAAEGIVELQRNRGARVREVTLEDAVQTLEVTELLTGLAARAAARAIASDEDGKSMGAALQLLDHASKEGDLRSFVRARREFFASLMNLSHNRELQRILATVHVHVLRAQFHLTDIQRQLQADYYAIGRAVLAGEPAQAEHIARRHVRRLRAAMIAANKGEQ